MTRARAVGASVAVFLGVVALLGALPQTPDLAAAEVHALSGGVHLADHLTRDGNATLRDRLARGFDSPADGPKINLLRDNHAWRTRVASAPLARWVTAVGVLAVPSDGHNLTRARWAAAVALALAVLLVIGWAYTMGPPSVFRAGAAGACLLLTPGALVAGTAAGAAAAAALAMALHLLVARALIHRGRAVLLTGISYGLLLAVHPLTAFLVVPLFTAVAIARRPHASGTTADVGHAPLPAIPLGLLGVPFVGLVVLLAVWPVMWADTARHLGGWLTSTMWYPTADHVIAGTFFDQTSGRAPQAWSAVWQWAGWTVLPVLGLWVAGVASAARRGRDGAWYPILTTATLWLAAGIDGGVWGGRLSALPLLWVTTAVTAGQGAIAAAAWLEERANLSRPGSLALVGVFLAAGLLAPVLHGQTPSRAETTGAELHVPVPLDLLQEIGAETPGARVHIVADGWGWEEGVGVARGLVETGVTWTHLDEADWAILAGEPKHPAIAARVSRLPDREPDRVRRRGGLVMKAWRLR